MKRSSNSRRRPAVQITFGRAARLHRLIMLLAREPRSRGEILVELGIGLRTFYRELELVKRCGIKVQQKNREYSLLTMAEQAKGRLPFPDPQLSFAELAELAHCPGEAGKRLAEMLAKVINYPAAGAAGSRRQTRRKEVPQQQAK